MVKMRPFPHEVALLQHDAPAASWAATHSLLSQISLFLLLWTEGANLRFMSETMWFFYWVLFHNPLFIKYCLSALTPAEPLSACSSHWRLKCRTVRHTHSHTRTHSRPTGTHFLTHSSAHVCAGAHTPVRTDMRAPPHPQIGGLRKCSTEAPSKARVSAYVCVGICGEARRGP